MKIINNRILIRPIYAEVKTKSGLILANYEHHSLYTREVFANQGIVIGKGERVEVVNIGDEVIFYRWGAHSVELDGEEVFFLDPVDLIAKIS